MSATTRVEFSAVHPLDDEHNQLLLQHTHPGDWVNPEPEGRYNLVVIGAGPAGLVTAAGAAGLGAKVALVEKQLMGGDCLNVGCVPSKALIRSARACADVRDAARFGVHIPDGARADFSLIMTRMRKLRAGLSHHDSTKRFRELGIDVFLGEGCFTGRNTFQLGDRTLRFAKACITTGARAVVPPIEGLAEAGYLTNETVFSLTQLPRRIAMLGAGPIGCELAQTFARFGSEVFLVEKAEQILSREDRDAAQRIQRALVRDGVKLVLGSKLSRVRSGEDAKFLVLESAGGNKELAVDEIFVGVGRAPNVDGLDLEAAGVEYDRTGVRVDERLRTSNPKIYAAGDICFPYKFTHTADAMARIVIGNALFFGRSKTSALTIPWCTYTDPEIAHVGMYAHEAEATGVAVDTFTVDLEDVDRAVLDGEDDGFLKVHVKKGTDKILGATLVARHAGDMISEITLAMTAGLGLKALSSTIHPYPTQAEVIKKAADAYSRTRLTPRVQKIFKFLLGLRR